MEGCKITRADGQGLLLEGYHRDARILRNDFEWIGSHAMVSWGRTSACLNANCKYCTYVNTNHLHLSSAPQVRNANGPLRFDNRCGTRRMH